jgi:hypothetical protein
LSDAVFEGRAARVEAETHWALREATRCVPIQLIAQIRSDGGAAFADKSPGYRAIFVSSRANAAPPGSR